MRRRKNAPQAPAEFAATVRALLSTLPDVRAVETVAQLEARLFEAWVRTDDALEGRFVGLWHEGTKVPGDDLIVTRIDNRQLGVHVYDLGAPRPGATRE